MRPTIAVLAGLALLVTAASAENLSYDYDKTADFASYKSYAWVPGTPVPDELNHKRVVAAIEEQLAAKGLRRVVEQLGLSYDAGSGPTLLAAYHATFDKSIQIQGFSSGFGPYRFAGSRSATAWIDKVTVGTLAVDLVDGKTRSIVWRGIATKELDPKASPEKREKNLRKVAEKMFKNYPPPLAKK